MMHFGNRRTWTGLLAILVLSPTAVQAGPLCDFLFGKKSETLPPYPVGQPVPVGNGYAAGYGVYPQAVPPATNYAPPAAYVPPPTSTNNGNYGTYYSSQLPVIGPAGMGYTAPTPSGITAATMPPTVSYVPNYRSSSYRTPVTYYRPVMTTDPRTGAQVVTMAPCTGYEYQTRRVPTWGYSALYGSTVQSPVAPAPQALPTYTLPSGGVPLASSSPVYSNPALPPMTGASPGLPQYSSAYPAPQTYPGTSGYANAPYTAAAPPTDCYNNCPPQSSGMGGYTVPSTPGLVAPPAPTGSGTIRTPAPTYGQPTTPPGTQASPPAGNQVLPPTQAPSGVFPPSTTPGADAGDVPPSLPPSFSSNASGPTQDRQRPQFQNIVQQPPSTGSDQPTSTQSERSSEPPSLAPIPVPDEFDTSPNWSPGLLKEGDMTAMRAGTSPDMPAIQLAGQSKRIHWASFQEPSQPPVAEVPTTRMRPITSPAFDSSSSEPSGQGQWQNLPSHSNASAEAPSPYDASGWRSSRK